MGTTTIPNGERRIWGIGLSDTCPPFGGGHVAAELGDQRVRSFVARRREQKDEIPDRAQGQIRCVHDGDSRKRFGSGAWTRTRITSSKGWRATNCTTPDRSRKV